LSANELDALQTIIPPDAVAGLRYAEENMKQLNR